MSFEGYYRFLCTKGHVWNVDVYDVCSKVICPHCGADVLWHELVDCTNDAGKTSPLLEVIPPTHSKETLPNGQVKYTNILGIYKLPDRITPRPYEPENPWDI